jgi:L-lactate dehydrogenase complex protein LldG
MSFDARADVLARIRAALESSNTHVSRAIPASPDVALREMREVPAADLRSRFSAELAAVSGEAVVLAEPGSDALALAVADHVERAGYAAIAVQPETLARMAASKIPSARLVDLSKISIEELEKADCAIVAAESLIADSGSAVVRLATYEERLLPYLPPACIIVARASAIASSLTVAALAVDEAERGERVIITGPSRTADIEKTVVLGAHGPGSVVVFVAEV